ncbi:MAG: Holliday junction branch migration protein RuvA [Clostridiales bacterium]|jgi:Holliday junction DNA helicase RuvA|nr:Holliday junction branch migration protein RuvA [Clostridiales bacterium]
MFYYIEGRVSHIEPHIAVIDCAGVGYLLNVTNQTQSLLSNGDTVKLYTHVYIKEDAFDLYGFYDIQERDCFRLLLGISGIGAKVALSILSTLSPEKFAIAVLSEDEKEITRSPGVGKKIAQRIILELKDKLKKSFGDIGRTGTAFGSQLDPEAGDKLGESIMALQVLGYGASEATNALNGVDPSESTENMVRYALKRLLKQ